MAFMNEATSVYPFPQGMSHRQAFFRLIKEKTRLRTVAMLR